MSRLHLFLLALFALPACDPPEIDTFRHDGGAAPEPVGVMTGSVLYVGPRPACTWHEDGTPSAVIGNAILLLFDYDNPPPPSGSAASARNLLSVNGRDLFSLATPLTAS